MKKFIIFFSFAIYYLLFTTPARAVCPVCTVAVGAGLGLARYLGVDDTVSGVWVGGLIISSTFWLVNWLKKKDFSCIPKFYALRSTFYTLTLMYVLFIAPLYFSQIIGHPFNTIWGIDKLVVGIIFGSLAFLLAMRADAWVRKMQGHQLFIYQKVVFPLSSLAIMSLVLYFITKR